MKEILESRRLLGADQGLTLKELNMLYKSLMKQHHPDRFQDATEREAAEGMSQRIISAYKLLEALHPETQAAKAEEFEETLASGIANWQYKGQVLKLHFGDGSEHAFYGVPPKTYNKFVGTDATPRFVRRHLAGTYPRRCITGAMVEA
ncbi:MAG: KTSC domain-containing protein [Flavobacteriales bacterium]|nr:KTSC domain-containing protein [Flavobacteriales bacterium]